MRSIIVVAILVAAQQCCLAKDTFFFKELHEPAWSDGRHHTQDFHAVVGPGKHLHFSYNATTVDNVHQLDKVPGFLGLSCDPSSSDVSVHLESAAAAEAFARSVSDDGYIVGPSWLGCVYDGHRVVLRRATAAPRVAGETVTIETAHASYLDVFESASVSLRTDAYTPGGQAPTQWDTSVRALPPPEGFFSDVIGFVSSIIHTVADDVAKIWHSIYTLAKIVAGEYSYGPKEITTFALKFNGGGSESGKQMYNLETGAVVTTKEEAKLVCTDCWAYADVGAYFELGIEDYKVKDLQIYAEGEAGYHMGMQAAVTEYISAQVHLQSILPNVSFTFAVGPIPFHIDLSFPMSAGVSVNVTAEVSEKQRIAHVAGGVGSVKYGYGLNQTTGEFSPIDQIDLKRTGNVTDYYTTEAELQVAAFVRPMVLCKIDYIGGPTVGVMASATVVVKAGEEQCKPGTGYQPAVLINLNFGVTISIGAFVDIDIPDFGTLYKWSGNWTFAKVNFVLYSGCFALPSPDANLLAPYYEYRPLMKGSTFGGIAGPAADSPNNCDRPARDVEMSLTLVQFSGIGNLGGVGKFMFTHSWVPQGRAVTCYAQHIMVAQWDDGHPHVATIRQLDDPHVDYAQCSDGRPPSRAMFKPGVLKFSHDFSNVTVTDMDNLCFCKVLSVATGAVLQPVTSCPQSFSSSSSSYASSGTSSSGPSSSGGNTYTTFVSSHTSYTSGKVTYSGSSGATSSSSGATSGHSSSSGTYSSGGSTSGSSSGYYSSGRSSTTGRTSGTSGYSSYGHSSGGYASSSSGGR